MTNDLASSIKDTLIDYLVPLQEAARNPKALADWLATLGHTQAISGDPALLEIARHAQALIEKLAAFDSETLKSWTGLASILKSGREVSEILQELREFGEDPVRSHISGGLAEEIMALLLASYLRRKHPTVFRIACLLALVEPRETASLDPSLTENGTTIRYGRILDRFKFGSINGLISRPDQTLKDAYFPNHMSAGADAWLSAARLFPNLSFLADALGLAWRTEYHPTVEPTPPSTDPDPDEALLGHIRSSEDDDTFPSPAPPVPDTYFASYHPTFRLTIAGAESVNGSRDVAIELLLSSRQHPRAIPGLIVTTVGDFNHTDSRGHWKLTFSASGEIPAFVVGIGGFFLAPGNHPLTGGSANLLIERLPPEGSSGPGFLFGSAEGTRLELGNLRLEMDLPYNSERISASIGLNATSCALILAPQDGDGFMSSLLPAEGLRANFDLGLTWSSEKGLTLRGCAGLDATLPIGLSFAGVTWSTVHLSLEARDAAVLAEVSANLDLAVGPVHAAIERVGISGALTFPEDGGNLGVADLDFDFKQPTGVGLGINEAAVTGGGFLRFDQDKGQYDGIVQLKLQGGISVTGIGLIATRLPDNTPGFSLLIIITAEELDIPLGLGFRLTAIGGLLAINRTFDEEALRAGLKNRTLDSVLMPKDPISNAPQLLSNLNKVFPPSPGHHLFGPVARIEWGTPTLITADLALVLELGERHRLLLLAQVVVILPKPENDLIRLQMDAIGVLDFDEGTAALDAVLYDSRLLKKFVLTGGMAMRLNLGSSPNFALAVGGLHPAFNPPPNFPKLDRIAINLTAGDNPRLRCEAYFALTANTVQFGARAELFAKKAGFSIQGEVGFDVLIQFSPFQFLAEFFAQVQVKRGTTNLFKVRVEGALAGPKPLHIKAKATFEILWWDVSVRIDTTLFEGEKPPLPEAVDVLPQLLDALAHPGNWVGRLPANQTQMVTLRARSVEAPEVLLHPLGVLTVKQGVVPLNMDISRFGQTTPAGARRFTIHSVNPEGQVQPAPLVKDFFAPAQFFEMSDAEKLSRPSFDLMAAGVEIGSHEITFSLEHCLPIDAIEFETKIYDRNKNKFEPGDPPDPVDPDKKVFHTLTSDLLLQQARFGAASVSDLRRSGSAKFRSTVGKTKVSKEGWSLVATDDLTVQPAPGAAEDRAMSYSEAEQALERLKREDPASAGRLKILRFQSEVQAVE